MRTLWRIVFALGCVLARATAEDLSALPEYHPEQKVSGVIRSWGSPHMGGMLRQWEAGFKKFHPEVAFADFLKGTASATYGFAENVAELGLMGRQIYTFEYYGVYRRSLMLPVEIEVATGSVDVPHKSFALAVFVHRDNPLTRLTLAQLDGIFGAQRTGGWQGMDWAKSAARGPEGNLRTWGQLGLGGEWADKPIQCYGPPGQHPGGIGFFQRRVMGGSDVWNENLAEFADRQAMIDALSRDRYGIAYTGLCYATPQVKALALAEKDGGPFVALTRENVASRAYPLSRPVYIYLAPDTPGGEPANPPVDPKVREFLRYILSRQGQQDVARAGDYLPLTAAVARAQLLKLDSPASSK
jgi:phosphate transport system substrate-binding protein